LRSVGPMEELWLVGLGGGEGERGPARSLGQPGTEREAAAPFF
jgi:hypothetical protein